LKTKLIVAPNFLESITSGISDLAISTLPAVGGAIGETVLPGVGAEIGTVLGTAAASALSPDESTSSGAEGMLGAPTLPPVARTILSFEGEQTTQTAVADVSAVSQQTESIESLRHFFKRPQYLDSMPLSYNSAWILPSEYFTRNIVQQKLKGYSGARFTMCLRVTSNSQPLCNGAYVVAFYPGDIATILQGNGEYANAASSAAQGDVFTLLQDFHAPHVVHDISQTTSTELRIPFFYPYRFMDTGTLLGLPSSDFSSANMLGRFDIRNIGKVIGADNQVVEGDLAVWMWLEDLELFYPTDFDSIHARNVKGVESHRYQTRDTFFAQGPEHHSHEQRSQIVIRRDDIDDVAHPPGNAKPMAITSSLVSVHGNASDSILDYFKIPSYLGHLTLSGSGDKGRIWVRPYTTCGLAKVIPEVTPTLTVYPPTKLSVAIDLFQFWKGSINYRFNFIASKFHSGRIQFGFVPHAALATTPGDSEIWSNINSTILDLREQHSVEINCPYRLAFNHAYSVDCSGTLIWRVLSPIVAPEGASAKIACFVETWAGDDFSVARYNPSKGAVSWGGFATLGKFVAREDLDDRMSYCEVQEPEAFYAQGPGLGESAQESVLDTVNDGVPTWSRILASITPLPTTFTQGVQKMFVGGDNDYLVSGWTVPRIGQSVYEPALQPELSVLEKVRSYFYGIHSDAYVNGLPSGFGVKYGQNPSARMVTFPYTGNTQYYGPGSISELDGGGSNHVTPFGSVYGAVGCLPNARVFHPWCVPLIDHMSDPRTTAYRAGRLLETGPMKGKSQR